jgi:antitoxin MazE
MRLQVKKWGNSAAVRIPASIIAAASMHIDQAVDVREEGGRIVIEPIAVPVFDLSTLLAQMDPATFHDQVEFGPVVGQEIW